MAEVPPLRPTEWPWLDDDLLRSVSLPSDPDLLAEKLQTRLILTLHLVSFQGVRSLYSDHTDEAIATFEDTNLEEAIRAALSVGAQEDLTCGLVSGLTNLTAQNAGIESLVGIQNLTGLTDIRFSGNSITDISVLSGLTSLTSRLIGRTSSC